MGFKLNNEVIEECAIAAYNECAQNLKSHDHCVKAAAHAVMGAVARQLEKVVPSPGSDLQTRLEPLLEFVPNEEPVTAPTTRARRKS